MTLRPSVPESWPRFTVRTRIGSSPCLVDLSGDEPTLRFDAPPPDDWVLEWSAGSEMLRGRVEPDPDGPDGWSHSVAWD